MGRPTKHEARYKNTGRPTDMTIATVNKLEEAFAIGCTDTEACLYADVSRQTLYNYEKKNPGFIDRKNALKETPMLLARKTIASALTQPEHARWYAERKRKDEFSGKIITESTMSDNLKDVMSNIAKISISDTRMI